MIDVLLAESTGIDPSTLVGGGLTLTGALAFAAYQLGRIATKLGSLVDGETTRRKAEDEHRTQEKRHWEVEEALLRHGATGGVPQYVHGDRTPPPHDLPLGQQ